MEMRKGTSLLARAVGSKCVLQFILTQFIELPRLHGVGVRSGVLFLRALREILHIYNTTQYIIRLSLLGRHSIQRA